MTDNSNKDIENIKDNSGEDKKQIKVIEDTIESLLEVDDEPRITVFLQAQSAEAPVKSSQVSTQDRQSNISTEESKGQESNHTEP